MSERLSEEEVAERAAQHERAMTAAGETFVASIEAHELRDICAALRKALAERDELTARAEKAERELAQARELLERATSDSDTPGEFALVMRDARDFLAPKEARRG